MRVVILGSGRGTNAEAILQAEKAGSLAKAKVVHLFSDRADSRFLTLGPKYGVPATFLDAAPFKTKLDGLAEGRYIDAISAEKPDLVVLAGFMRVLKPGFLGAFEGKIINLHPSLLPAFPGLDAIGQAHRAGVKQTGCTVHRVTLAVDAGPVLDRALVPIEPGQTIEQLEAKVHAAEHALLPAVIARLSASTS